MALVWLASRRSNLRDSRRRALPLSAVGECRPLNKSERTVLTPGASTRKSWIVARRPYIGVATRGGPGMTESRKLAAILVTDIVGYSRLAGADEDRILARLRTLRSDLIEPTISVHRGRVVKGTGDGVHCRISQRGRRRTLRDRVAAWNCRAQRRPAARAPDRVPGRHPSRRRGRGERRRPDGRRRQYRRASRRHRQARRDLPVGGRLSAGQGRLDLMVSDLGQTELKNIAEPIRVYSLEVGAAPGQPRAKPLSRGKAGAAALVDRGAAVHQSWRGCRARALCRRRDGEPDDRPLAHQQCVRGLAQHRLHIQRQAGRRQADRPRSQRALHPRGKHSARRQPNARQCPAHRRDHRQPLVGGPVRQADGRPVRHAGRNCLSARQSSCARSCSPRKQGAPRLWRTRISSTSISRGFSGSTRAGSTTSSAARGYFERAVALDPTNIDALVGAARADVLVGAIFTTEHRGRAPGRRRGAA